MIVLVDNRDSFTFNLVQAFAGLGAPVRVEAGERVTASEILALAPRAIVLGPGPGGPLAARTSLDLVRIAPPELPQLGVCLGFQVIAAAFGARVAPAPRPVHGHADAIDHDGRGVFHALPRPARMGRYHSLAVVERTVPAELEVSARAADGTIQGLRHRDRPLEGVQFHPESVLSDHGLALLANFVASVAGR